MAFFKFRSQGQPGHEARGAPPAAPAESVEAMRRRARHRLLGAAVLVLAGVIGFPLLFDTQPRPVAVDIPIEIPDRNQAKPLAVPEAPAAQRSSPAPAGDTVITERADGTEIVAAAPSAPAPQAAPKPEPKPDPKPEPKPEPRPEPKPKPETRSEAAPKPAEHKPADSKPAEPKPAAKPASHDDGSRALALLQGKPVPAKPAADAKPDAKPDADAAGRFVIQIGAFADASKARETRQKLEKAGIKTYTQVAKTADGERTRVRVGPFGSRAEADRAAERIKGLALPAAVLTL